MLGEKESEILSRELLRSDSEFKNFLYVVNFASVYHYSDREWNKLNIEGTFVMYTKHNCSSINIHIFNRKSLQDFTFSIRRETQIGIDEGLITLQNEESDGIYGLWFHSDTHPRRILNCLRTSL